MRLRPDMAVALLALVVHGMQAPSLGLYWDDAEQLMQPFQAVGYRLLPFVLSDTAGSLVSERPAAYLAFAMTRAAFVVGIAAVHWTLVGLLALNAVLVTRLAYRLLASAWLGFAAGVVFVVYPIAPLQTIWPATVHYHLACGLALLAVLAAARAADDDGGRTAWWLAGAAVAYAISILTHEAVAFLPLAVVATQMVRGRRWVRPALMLGAVLALFALWRLLLLPAYGDPLYAPSMPFRHPRVLVVKTVHGIAATLFPWPKVLQYVAASTTPAWLFAALGVASATWLVSRALLATEHPAPPAIREDCAPGAADWLWVIAAGLALLVAGVLAVALSPIGIEVLFTASYGPRGNFVVMPGVAIAIPGILALVARALRSRREVASVALAALAFLGSLLQFDLKQAFAAEWVAHKTMLASLRQQAPRVAPDTVIVIADARDRRAPYAAHYEVSSYLLALYDDWSVIGNTVTHLRFHREGLESTYHGTPGRWFPPDVRAPMATGATRHLGRISYDRVLLFAREDGVLRALSTLDVTTVDGEPIRLRTNADRIRAGAPVATPMWRHLTR